MQTIKRRVKFICSRHRSELEANPERSKTFWGNAILSGRSAFDSMLWEKAIRYFGNAMEAAGILMMTDTDTTRKVQRYTRTAEEFIYVLKFCQRVDDSRFIKEMVEEQLENLQTPQSTKELMEPVISASTASVEQTNHRLTRRVSAQNTVTYIR